MSVRQLSEDNLSECLCTALFENREAFIVLWLCCGTPGHSAGTTLWTTKHWQKSCFLWHFQKKNMHVSVSSSAFFSVLFKFIIPIRMKICSQHCTIVFFYYCCNTYLNCLPGIQTWNNLQCSLKTCILINSGQFMNLILNLTISFDSKSFDYLWM